jgi:hypothetical protein
MLFATYWSKQSSDVVNACWIGGPHGSEYEEYSLLGCDTMYFERNMLPPMSWSKNKPSKKPEVRHLFWLVSCLTLRPSRWRWYVPLKCWTLPNSVTTQKTILSIVNAYSTAKMHLPDLFGSVELLNTCFCKSFLFFVLFFPAILCTVHVRGECMFCCM